MCAKYRRSVRFRPSRFNGTIDVDTGLTSYMWSGKPVACLEKGSYGDGPESAPLCD
jgi:hypothetical protein